MKKMFLVVDSLFGIEEQSSFIYRIDIKGLVPFIYKVILSGERLYYTLFKQIQLKKRRKRDYEE